VNNLVDRFSAAQKMMKQMRTGKGMPGLPGMPGMPAMGGMGGPGMGLPAPMQQKVAPKKKSKSGNPAKRAAEEA
jgi:signal recognition particle subunit SRP54